MWRFILIIISCTILVNCKLIDQQLEEGRLWPPQQHFGLIYRNEIIGRRNAPDTTYSQRAFEQQQQQQQPKEQYNSDVYNLLLPNFTNNNKRALAMIGRWGPFSNIGKQRTPIRSNPSVSELDANINTQTRARMQGQPLRWG